jgi:hypothetical protein
MVIGMHVDAAAPSRDWWFTACSSRLPTRSCGQHQWKSHPVFFHGRNPSACKASDWCLFFFLVCSVLSYTMGYRLIALEKAIVSLHCFYQSILFPLSRVACGTGCIVHYLDCLFCVLHRWGELPVYRAIDSAVAKVK